MKGEKPRVLNIKTNQASNRKNESYHFSTLTLTLTLTLTCLIFRLVLVWSGLISFGLVLSCPVLSCFVSFRLVLSYLEHKVATTYEVQDNAWLDSHGYNINMTTLEKS